MIREIRLMSRETQTNVQSRIEATSDRGARISKGRLCCGVILLLEDKSNSVSGIGSLATFGFRSGCEWQVGVGNLLRSSDCIQ